MLRMVKKAGTYLRFICSILENKKYKKGWGYGYLKNFLRMIMDKITIIGIPIVTKVNITSG